jgi:uncharacterized protein
MSTQPDEPHVVHDPERRRYEIFVDGSRAGFAAYRDEPRRRVFTHTEVDPSFEGRGLGDRLVAFALDETRAEGLRVVPLCSFIAAYITRHPGYQDLLAPAS